MSEIDILNATEEEIQKTLHDLMTKGEVFASCPKCKIFLSVEELDNKKCSCCNKKFKQKDVVYFPNESVGQNN